MRRAAILMALCLPGGAIAEEEWTPLTGAEIQTALSDWKLSYGQAWQEFRVSGRTLYNAGQDSWGYWAVRGDQYCSMWPPSDLWACYDMARSGEWLRFIGPQGDITEGRYVSN